ncbi:hypothetical protein CEUSTIGMA_g4135.t1 [Chlamydomonas eustigma]|uniref:RAP domain-containing protein n=1 Tax=Chlamydomonas eustigma TaxID=1157962 RepID=A0A250X180_9CHLO|nr:hypothetical protein CEUSTIGMA_g4135.t1 [Chlamydomonas eustigma]|eukprot:GAX76689.1 hypothetical protein CEUSTIGMA_g4135.t1 [Chlamydomonas eustigma]
MAPNSSALKGANSVRHTSSLPRRGYTALCASISISSYRFEPRPDSSAWLLSSDDDDDVVEPVGHVKGTSRGRIPPVTSSTDAGPKTRDRRRVGTPSVPTLSMASEPRTLYSSLNGASYGIEQAEAKLVHPDETQTLLPSPSLTPLVIQTRLTTKSVASPSAPNHLPTPNSLFSPGRIPCDHTFPHKVSRITTRNLSSLITASLDLQQLERLWKSSEVHMDALHVAAMIGKLPGVCKQQYSARLEVPEAYHPFIHELCQRAHLHLCSYKTRQLSNMLWVLAKLRLGSMQPRLTQDILTRLLPPSDAYAVPEDLHLDAAMDLSAQVSTSYRTDDFTHHRRRGTKGLTRVLCRSGPEDTSQSCSTKEGIASLQSLRYSGNAQDTSNAAWALAKLFAQQEPVGDIGSKGQALLGCWQYMHEACHSVLFAAERTARSMKPQEVVNTSWAFAKICMAAERVAGNACGDGMLDEDEEGDDQLSVNSVGMTYAESHLRHALSQRSLLSCSAVEGVGGDRPPPEMMVALKGCLGGELGQRALTLAEEGSLDRQQAPNLAWVCARLGYHNTRLLEGLATCTLGQLRSLTAQGISMSLWAYARLQYMHPGLIKGLATAASWKVRKFRGQSLANFAWALTEFRYYDPTLYSLLAREALYKIEEQRPLGLTTLLTAWSASGYYNISLFSAAGTAALQQLPSFRPHTLVRLLQACSRVGHRDPTLAAAAGRKLISWTEAGLLQPEEVATCITSMGLSLVKLLRTDCWEGPKPYGANSVSQQHQQQEHAPGSHAQGSNAPQPQNLPSIPISHALATEYKNLRPEWQCKQLKDALQRLSLWLAPHVGNLPTGKLTTLASTVASCCMAVSEYHVRPLHGVAWRLPSDATAQLAHATHVNRLAWLHDTDHAPSGSTVSGAMQDPARIPLSHDSSAPSSSTLWPSTLLTQLRQVFLDCCSPSSKHASLSHIASLLWAVTAAGLKDGKVMEGAVQVLTARLLTQPPRVTDQQLSPKWMVRVLWALSSCGQAPYLVGLEGAGVGLQGTGDLGESAESTSLQEIACSSEIADGVKNRLLYCIGPRVQDLDNEGLVMLLQCMAVQCMAVQSGAQLHMHAREFVPLSRSPASSVLLLTSQLDGEGRTVDVSTDHGQLTLEALQECLYRLEQGMLSVRQTVCLVPIILGFEGAAKASWIEGRRGDIMLLIGIRREAEDRLMRALQSSRRRKEKATAPGVQERELQFKQLVQQQKQKQQLHRHDGVLRRSTSLPSGSPKAHFKASATVVSGIAMRTDGMSDDRTGGKQSCSESPTMQPHLSVKACQALALLGRGRSPALDASCARAAAAAVTQALQAGGLVNPSALDSRPGSGGSGREDAYLLLAVLQLYSLANLCQPLKAIPPEDARIQHLLIKHAAFVHS